MLGYPYNHSSNVTFQVNFILNELVMGGMVLETNMNEILTRIEDKNKIEKEEVRLSNEPNDWSAVALV